MNSFCYNFNMFLINMDSCCYYFNTILTYIMPFRLCLANDMDFSDKFNYINTGDNMKYNIIAGLQIGMAF